MHRKSPCCHAKIRRYGNKRRQCVACHKTWSVHPSNRGRRKIRTSNKNLDKVLLENYLVKHLSRGKISSHSAYKRFQNDLDWFVSQKRDYDFKQSSLVLVSDGKWYKFNNENWTAYVIGIKQCHESKIEIMDPLLLPGKESANHWRYVINTHIPKKVKKQVKAVVFDSIRGIETVVRENNWILQRCHYHLLKNLEKRKGKRATTPGRLTRQKIYVAVETLLKTNKPEDVKKLVKRLNRLVEEPKCPKAMKMAVNEFIRRLDSYHSYLKYPELNIPYTTNTIESFNSKLKAKTSRIKTARSMQKWLIAIAQKNKYFKCQ